MIKRIFTVFRKEVRENLRDRRTLVSAFLFVPLMGPILFAVMTTLMVDRVVGEVDESLRLPLIGADRAPNLVRYFEENSVDVVRLPHDLDSAREAVKAGREKFVFVIDSTFGTLLDNGEPASLDLIWDSSDNKAQRYVGRARALVDSYSHRLGNLRLLARGVDPNIVSPIDVHSIDVATPSSRAIVLLGTLTYYLLFSLLLGGMYLAIDVTAGERERGSLESLLCLPVPRSHLVLGKIAATAVFMLAALTLTLTALVASMQRLPLEKLGMASNFSALLAVKIAAIMIPMAIFGSALLFLVGSFTRSYREAQTWLGALLAIPTLPILFASISNVRSSTFLMVVPSLSQHLLATSLLRGDALQPLHVAVSVLTTTAAGALLVWVATRLYRRERLLG